jgi:hypothetical protein
MKNHYISGSVKVLTNYLIMLLLFIVFLLVGINHLAIYSSVILVLGLFIVYSDFNSLALKERKPGNNTVNYPLKGFLMGFLGFSPIILISLLLNFIDIGSTTGNQIKLAILKVITGPIFGFLSANLLLLLIIPIAAGAAYLSGYYGIGKPKFLNPKPRKKVVKK